MNSSSNSDNGIDFSSSSSSSSSSFSSPSLQDKVRKGLHFAEMKYQSLMDKLTPHKLYRWIFAAFLFLYFIFVIFTVQGFYVVAYTLGIYLLNLLIGFLSPKTDPDSVANNSGGGVSSDEQDAGASLPVKSDDEYRPFIRRLPEFFFWRRSFWALLLADIATFFPMFDIPVFWPILLAYFVALFFGVVRDRVRHMIKHKYVPFSFGKTVYNNKK